jgi:hypothetical protein
MEIRGKLIFPLMLFFSLAFGARADETYTYTGNPYTSYLDGTCPSVCGVTATFDLSSALAPDMPLTDITPVSFSITDGSVTESSTTVFSLYEVSSFEVSTNSLGDILTWDVYATACCINGQYYMIETRNIPSGLGSGVLDQTQTYDVGEAFNEFDPGTWTSTSVVPTPEPGILPLLGAGLLGILGLARRKLRA